MVCRAQRACPTENCPILSHRGVSRDADRHSALWRAGRFPFRRGQRGRRRRHTPKGSRQTTLDPRGLRPSGALRGSDLQSCSFNRGPTGIAARTPTGLSGPRARRVPRATGESHRSLAAAHCSSSLVGELTGPARTQTPPFKKTRRTTCAVITDSSPNTQKSDNDTRAPARTHDKPHTLNLSTITDSSAITRAKIPPRRTRRPPLAERAPPPPPPAPRGPRSRMLNTRTSRRPRALVETPHAHPSATSACSRAVHAANHLCGPSAS